MISNESGRTQQACEDCCCDGNSELFQARRDAEVVLEQVGRSLQFAASRLNRNDCRKVRSRLRRVDAAIHGSDTCHIRKALADLRTSVLEAVHHMPP